MIELRWMIRESDEVNLDGPGPILNRVLQYRQQVMMPVGGWTQGEEPQRRPEWTPWADVPTVKGY